MHFNGTKALIEQTFPQSSTQPLRFLQNVVIGFLPLPTPIIGFSADIVSQIKLNWKSITTGMFEECNPGQVLLSQRLGQRGHAPELRQRDFMGCRRGVMTCLHRLHLYLSKIKIKNWALWCGLGQLTTSGEEAALATKNAEPGFLVTFLCLETLWVSQIWREKEREREEWDFPDHAGAQAGGSNGTISNGH